MIKMIMITRNDDDDDNTYQKTNDVMIKMDRNDLKMMKMVVVVVVVRENYPFWTDLVFGSDLWDSWLLIFVITEEQEKKNSNIFFSNIMNE